MASGGGGLIGATGAAHARVGAVGGSVVGGTLHGSGAPDEEAQAHPGSGSPTMPHLELRGQELDNAYPPLPVPQDELLPGAAQDEDGLVHQSGLKVAATIRRETADHGRKEKMSPNAEEPEQERARGKGQRRGEEQGQRQSKGAQDEEENLNLVDSATAAGGTKFAITGLQEATPHESSPGRRRSVCGGPASEALSGWDKNSLKILSEALEDDVEGSELPIRCVHFCASVSRARPAPLGSRRLPVDTAESFGIPSLY